MVDRQNTHIAECQSSIADIRTEAASYHKNEDLESEVQRLRLHIHHQKTQMQASNQQLERKCQQLQQQMRQLQQQKQQAQQQYKKLYDQYWSHFSNRPDATSTPTIPHLPQQQPTPTAAPAYSGPTPHQPRPSSAPPSFPAVCSSCHLQVADCHCVKELDECARLVQMGAFDS